MSARIVVCDDDAYIRRAVSFKLERAGLDVEAVPDGEKAWDSIQRKVPALLITDCQIPGLSGLQLCQRLRAHPETRDLQVILLTGKGWELDREQLREELRIVKLIGKPFSPRDLLLTVQGMIGVAPALG